MIFYNNNFIRTIALIFVRFYQELRTRQGFLLASMKKILKISIIRLLTRALWKAGNKCLQSSLFLFSMQTKIYKKNMFLMVLKSSYVLSLKKIIIKRNRLEIPEILRTTLVSCLKYSFFLGAKRPFVQFFEIWTTNDTTYFHVYI